MSRFAVNCTGWETEESNMASKRDYYEVLGVHRSCTEDDLKSAYRRLAKQYHPDVNKSPDAEERFKEINEAYEVLCDPDKRAAYDRYGHAGLDGSMGGMGGMGGFTGFGVEDIFESFFGGMRTSQRGPQRGADLRYDLVISFEEAVFGCEKEIEISRWEVCPTCSGTGSAPGTSPSRCPLCHGSGEVRRVQQTIFGRFVNVMPCDRCGGKGTVITKPCPTCSGEGRVRASRRLQVKIPAGVDDGTQMRLAGEGEMGAMGGPAGNLYVVLQVRRHRFFRRDHSDILLDVNINVAQAALGDEVEVPTVDGPAKIAIPAGTQHGDTIVLKGKGVPQLQSSRRGDQIVHVNVVTPTRLTDEQRRLFQELAKSLGREVSPQEEKGFFEKVKDAFGV
jgi:molecular chaperone DnaJ